MQSISYNVINANNKKEKTMKFLLFSDFHHSAGLFKGGTVEHIKLFEQRAKETGCDMMIHAGDFCHGTDHSMDAVEAYNNSEIPTYHCLGNHDSDFTPLPKVLEAYKMENDYYFFDRGGYRFIVYDTNYIKEEDGSYVHFDVLNYKPKASSMLYYMPPKELEWLRETIESSEFPCVLIGHESIERVDGIKNRDEIMKLINDANKKKKHSVIMCINGHYHRDHVSVIENVCYLDVNSTICDWVENKHELFPEELNKSIKYMKHSIIYNDPLHAIVTLEGNRIRIEGMESSMFMGITVEMTGNPKYDRMGREARPYVGSVDITLN